MQHEVSRLTPQDELEDLVSHINAAQWDEANEICPHSVDALRAYLQTEGAVFLTCYLLDGDSRTFAGMASGRLEQKPYDFEKWLYIDEVDTCSNLRKRGVGTALMNELLEIADENDCDEVWLGTELDNDAANALYKSLKPTSIETFVGYTWEIEG